MIFNLKRPCADCPFLLAMDYRLGRERAESIVHGITDESTFCCHKTCESTDDGDRVPGARAQFCAGALIIAEKTGRRGAGMQIGIRLGEYDPSRLDMSAPVYRDFETWIEAQAG